MRASVTEQLAEWIVTADYGEIPAPGVERVKERVLDSLGVQLAGMSVSTGATMARWVQAQGSRPESSVVAAGWKTTATLATLVNGTAGHALEFDDVAVFSGHYANPLTAAALAVGEKLGCSGQDMVLAWLVGYEVIAQTAKPCAHPRGNTLLVRGWFNQGFQPVLGVAALTARLMGLDVTQTRMALGTAAAAMGGLMKNRGSDAKSFTAGNAAMHGVMAAELAALGFTANDEIIDGEIGVARLLGSETADADQVLDGLGTWHMATLGSTMRLHASCAAAHWAQDALQKIVRRRPLDPDEIDVIEVSYPGFLSEMMPYQSPRTGLEAKYSMEYDLAAIALDGRAGVAQYTDEMVARPQARALMARVRRNPLAGDMTTLRREAHVVVTLDDGNHLEETVTVTHGRPEDPLTADELAGKFHECAQAMLSRAQRDHVIELCGRLDALDDVRELAELVGASA